MKKKVVGYPKTVGLLKRHGYLPSDFLIRGFTPFTHLQKGEPFYQRIRRVNSPVVMFIIYPVFLWEKYHNLH